MFKALLFLCVGVGIHTVFGTQDFRRYGHVTSSLPSPRALLCVANLALLGFPCRTSAGTGTLRVVCPYLR